MRETLGRLEPGAESFLADAILGPVRVTVHATYVLLLLY